MIKTKTEIAIIPSEIIESKIYLVRGQKVMVDRDLARLYSVQTKVLKQAVKRNINRFPRDFMIQLTKGEFANWRSQFVTSNKDKMGLRYPPMVFTEQGVAMLSSVLNSERAVQVNIQIMRTFTKIRELLATNEVLRRKIEALERKYDQRFKVIFDVIKKLISAEEKPKARIGFEANE
ncbi:MAG: DNA-binding protein [Candidatus Komeilibacteria bacterium RIFCSPLOWO2_02_FULL_48_11]|uniref:DNA-binding protein n=1 Tax=Candidatus Komeilibacteria bacterium RIFCSPLOWO2_02_FULL_48_11 TaxID=1798553 RepID=A0A1G2BYA6_9BACT|nr:MAG: DNA-binding protein [Candidatus Komeilibacteria bacterium RIFCSPLOWO2_02_FULL_48_11]